MLSLTFTLDGLTQEAFERQLDNAIALNDPSTAIDLVEGLIQKHNIKCTEVEDYLNNSQQVHGTSYQQSTAFLIYGTYYRIKKCAQERVQFLDPYLQVNKFKLWNCEKCCSYCYNLGKKIYSKSTLPELPHHPGCECMLAPIFDLEDDMGMKCIGCDTPIPDGAVKCPMCGAPVQYNDTVQIVQNYPSSSPIQPTAEIHHYYHHVSQDAQPVLIEKTGKKWKKLKLWSAFCCFIGLVSCAGASGDPNSGAMGVSLACWFVGVVLYIYARSGAWWHHG